MKMVIVTAVEEYTDRVLELLRAAGIESFSGSAVEGYKNLPPVLFNRSWFPSEKGGARASLFFSYIDAEKVGRLFALIKEFNGALDSNNPIKAVELPIERFI